MRRALGCSMHRRQGTLNIAHVRLILGRHAGELAGAVVKLVHAFLRLTDALAKLRYTLIELLRARYRLIHAIVIGVAIDCQLIGQIARAVLELLELASYRIIQAEIIHLRAEITQLRANILRFFGFIAF